MSNPPKFPSIKHWPWSQTIHRDDSVLTNPEAFLNKEIVILEKLDGGNTCLYQGGVFARSTSQEATQGWFAMVKKHHAYKSLQRPELAIYGEDLFGIHSIEYDPLFEDETYRPFAMLNSDGIFLDWDNVVGVASDLGLKPVPVRARGIFKTIEEITTWFDTNIKLPSILGGPCEGFVMRDVRPFSYDVFERNVTKYVRANHVQTDEHWTKNWKPCSLKGLSYA